MDKAVPDSIEQQLRSVFPDGTFTQVDVLVFSMRSDVADEALGFATVQANLGAADLATVDAMITAGIASSRAEAMRWAIGRIRENPACAQIRDKGQNGD